MLLVIDAGNTNVTFGIYEGSQLITHWRIRTEHGRTGDEYAALLTTLFQSEKLNFSDIDGICIASVVPSATVDLRRLAERHFQHNPLIVSGEIPIGITVNYHPVTDIGADRLVDAVAAVHKFGAPCIVIDFGTATTFNAIAAPERPGDPPVYLGGAICPGIALSAEALFSHAAKLAAVEMMRPPQAIGANTVHALQSGMLFGYAAQVDGMVARFRAEMNAPDCPVIATGGHVSVLISKVGTSITASDPLLTLDGLQLVYAHNQSI
ncbi:MAG: type III pantothenate kinase [Capsulimonas sp.]|uniref:type III pantothenate kinase n=1 Tax=Capsulimonas sp. TaxID=2494211 RepID=UPI0032655F6F